MMKIVAILSLLVTAAAWAPRQHAAKSIAPGRVRAPQQVTVVHEPNAPEDAAPPKIPAQLAVALPVLCTAAPALAADDASNPLVTAVQAVVVGGVMFTLGMMQPWRNDN